MSYLVINGGAQNSGQSWLLGHGAKDFIKTFGDVHLFQFSPTIINVVVVSTMLIFIQIVLLKNYLDKRWAK